MLPLCLLIGLFLHHIVIKSGLLNKIHTKILEIHIFSYDYVQAVAGAHNIKDLNEINQSVSVLKFIRHPEYDYNGLKNDVAMVKLGEFLDMTSEYVRPISLTEQKQANWSDELDGEMTKVCGWGKISLRPQVYPDELHCVDVPIGKF